jgi:hypothetical protein
MFYRKVVRKMTDYNKLSAEELRELLLSDELKHELMTEEDYTALLDIETEYDAPSEKVIDFCADGLMKFPKYKNVGSRGFDISELTKSEEVKPFAPKRRKLRKVVFVAAAIITTMLLAQLVAAAMGYNLFEFVFNWNKPDVVHISNENIAIQTAHSTDNEIINKDFELEYTTIEDMPTTMKNFLPNYVYGAFEFIMATHLNRDNSEVYLFYFFDEKENILLFGVKKAADIIIEKDDDGYYEEYTLDGVLFKIFTNMGDFQAMWIYNGYVYSLHTHFDDVSKIKEILGNLY